MSNRSQARRAVRRAVKRNWYESPWQIAGRAISASLTLLVIGALLALVVVPRVQGGDSLTVLSGSMEPTFAPGDLVAVKGIDEADVCSEISVGDIVSYFPKPNDPTLITHRVVGKTIGTFDDGTNCRLMTQGDANSTVDEPVSPAQVRGVFMYGVPKLGWARQWFAQNPQNLMYIAAGILVIWVLAGAFQRPKTRIVSIPRTDGAQQPQTAAASAAIGEQDQLAERELRERELQIREREIALREREFELALQQAALPTPPVPAAGQEQRHHEPA